jgi:uncharacterized cupredoxin-like copper-binding protein
MRLAVLAVAAVAALMLAACGGDHDHGSDAGASAPTATFEVDMRDTAFAPKRLSVPADTRVTFVFRNRGKLVHEAFLGDEAEQRAHDAEMVGDGAGGATATMPPSRWSRAEPGA